MDRKRTGFNRIAMHRYLDIAIIKHIPILVLIIWWVTFLNCTEKLDQLPILIDKSGEGDEGDCLSWLILFGYCNWERTSSTLLLGWFPLLLLFWDKEELLLQRSKSEMEEAEGWLLLLLEWVFGWRLSSSFNTLNTDSSVSTIDNASPRGPTNWRSRNDDE